MNGRERIKALLRSEVVKPVPKGDFIIESKILEDLYQHLKSGRAEKESGEENWSKEALVRDAIGMDLMLLHEYPAREVGSSDKGGTIFEGCYGEVFEDKDGSTHLSKAAIEELNDDSASNLSIKVPFVCLKTRWFAENTDLFLLGQIMGPVSGLQWLQGMERSMMDTITEGDIIREISSRFTDLELERAMEYKRAGIDGILIADDIGFNTGLMFPKHILEDLVYPFYKKMVAVLKEAGLPVFFHSDGDINGAMDSLIACGFDGIQSLQPSAGMDIQAIGEKYPDVILMGNLDLDYLMPFGEEDEVRKASNELVQSMSGRGKFILSTCNILTNAIPVDNVLAMYGVDSILIR